jgi:hypothetical protein
MQLTAIRASTSQISMSDELIAHRFSDGSAVHATCSEFIYKG